MLEVRYRTARALPLGRATLAPATPSGILVHRAGPTPRYRVECWRSFSTYVHGFLAEAALGLAPAEKARMQ